LRENGEATMNARMRVNRAIEQSFDVACESSNTLKHSNARHGDTLRVELIEATVQAVAAGSVPRLGRTLALP
jgi:hypothetical protein